jgi:hypothetical protein
MNVRNSDFLISDIKDKAEKISDFIFKEINLENKLKDLAKEYTEFAINEIKGGEDVEEYFIEFFYYEWY